MRSREEGNGDFKSDTFRHCGGHYRMAARQQHRRGNAPVIKRDKMALWGKILLACIPAAVVGVLFDSVFERLFYHALPVAAALAVFGVLS